MVSHEKLHLIMAVSHSAFHEIISVCVSPHDLHIQCVILKYDLLSYNLIKTPSKPLYCSRHEKSVIGLAQYNGQPGVTKLPKWWDPGHYESIVNFLTKSVNTILFSISS